MAMYEAKILHGLDRLHAAKIGSGESDLMVRSTSREGTHSKTAVEL